MPHPIVCNSSQRLPESGAGYWQEPRLSSLASWRDRLPPRIASSSFLLPLLIRALPTLMRPLEAVTIRPHRAPPRPCSHPIIAHPLSFSECRFRDGGADDAGLRRRQGCSQGPSLRLSLLIADPDGGVDDADPRQRDEADDVQPIEPAPAVVETTAAAVQPKAGVAGREVGVAEHVG